VSASYALVQAEETRASADAPSALDVRRKYVVAHAQTAFLQLAEVRRSAPQPPMTMMTLMMVLMMIVF